MSALGRHTWETVPRVTLIIPIGSLEQHGPHLPLHTDSVIAEAVAVRVAASFPFPGDSRPGRSAPDTGTVIVGPALPYGASGEHQDFPGTVSIGTSALATVCVELGRSALHWAPRVCLLNGHGGNVAALGIAVRALRAEGRDVAWASCAVRGEEPSDLHAGDAETSAMQAVLPAQVRTDRMTRGLVHPPERLLPELRRHGVRALAPSGVLGDPREASPATGTTLLEQATAEVRERIAAWNPRAADGMLEPGPSGTE
ncbi:mycofactocin biosynthesis peptidyl-dipeptidase MftE [Leucobacter chromiireducens]|uniref:Mycofactocin biosynthesis peptidyl-dipeptidase MftE n=1 Tax=Leucobacter chromiireducens subsp. solipictus TaxID=398235 RepID=A0ABS1SI89_9MICO|nr:mycofactocin biosynthesis peptidyl-dipeptidase MftE [Leucobacter chromiireducens subsp. solipictus]